MEAKIKKVKEKTLNQLYKESDKKVSFAKFAEDYNSKKQLEQPFVAETEKSSTKDYSGLQILAVIGIAVGIYLLVKKNK